MNRNREWHDTIVIGAGQCGLAASHELKERGIDHVVLEAQRRVGDQWRSRYDSLRLYSPARFDSLPGLAFPLPPHAFPTGRQMGDYLETYAAHLDLPVRTSSGVDSLRREGNRYVVNAGTREYGADNVVIAAGPFRRPVTPGLAAQLDPAINQLHSNDYREPSQLVAGPVLVVGMSHSGADLAMEARSAGHATILAGKSHGQLPFSVDSTTGRLAWPVLRFIGANLLTLRTPIGRRMARKMRGHGAPLLRYRRKELTGAGVELYGDRVIGVRNGRPALADGRELEVANVIWCTGFRPDFGWIELPIFDADGRPRHSRGVVPDAPGLYFVGLPFQTGFTSMLVVGAASDARRVVRELASRSGAQRRTVIGAGAAA